MSHFFVSFELEVQRPARRLPNLGVTTEDDEHVMYSGLVLTHIGTVSSLTEASSARFLYVKAPVTLQIDRTIFPRHTLHCLSCTAPALPFGH